MQDKELAKNLFYFLIESKKYMKNQFSLPHDSPLTKTQFKTLIVLKKYDSICLKDLSNQINVSNSSLSIMLNKLVDEGWVTRIYCKTDRRSTSFTLTEKGTQFIKCQVEDKICKLTKKVELLSSEDKQVLASSIDNIQDILGKI